MADLVIPFLFQKSVALSSYRDRQFRVKEVFFSLIFLALMFFLRVMKVNKIGNYYKVQHFMSEIYHSLQLKNKFMNYFHVVVM